MDRDSFLEFCLDELNNLSIGRELDIVILRENLTLFYKDKGVTEMDEGEAKMLGIGYIGGYMDANLNLPLSKDSCVLHQEIPGFITYEN